MYSCKWRIFPTHLYISILHIVQIRATQIFRLSPYDLDKLTPRNHIHSSFHLPLPPFSSPQNPPTTKNGKRQTERSLHLGLGHEIFQLFQLLRLCRQQPWEKILNEAMVWCMVEMVGCLLGVCCWFFFVGGVGCWLVVGWCVGAPPINMVILPGGISLQPKTYTDTDWWCFFLRAYSETYARSKLDSWNLEVSVEKKHVNKNSCSTTT